MKSDPNMQSGNVDLVLEAMQHVHAIRSVLWRLTRNWADVDELEQETYVRLLRYAQRPGNVQALAITTARNLAIDRFNHLQVVPIELMPEVDELEDLHDEALLEDIAHYEQQLQQVLGAVRKLPERDRRVFVLRKVYGYKPMEIGRKLKLSIGQVERALTSSLKTLSDTLGQELPSCANGYCARLRREK